MGSLQKCETHSDHCLRAPLCQLPPAPDMPPIEALCEKCRLPDMPPGSAEGPGCDISGREQKIETDRAASEAAQMRYRAAMKQAGH
jgi:hypothetical protein